MNIPQHIAIIMDGNGRWASKRFLPSSVGHEQGGKTVQRVIDLCKEKGISWLTLYAFSTENWNRPEKEVAYLMRMLKKYLLDNLADMIKKNIRMHVIGEIYMLPEDCREAITKCLETTKDNDSLNVVLALSYGSRHEIIAAAKELARKAQAGEINPDDISEDVFEKHLYTAGMPDPDLLIRSSGEFRLSNYLLWQLSYSELYICETLWPDFGRKEFDLALEVYSKRQRRYGLR